MSETGTNAPDWYPDPWGRHEHRYFDGQDWTLERHAPDFSPLPFHQRWLATFSPDGHTIQGRWETSPDGTDWRLDFELTYHRVT